MGVGPLLSAAQTADGGGVPEKGKWLNGKVVKGAGSGYLNGRGENRESYLRRGGGRDPRKRKKEKTRRATVLFSKKKFGGIPGRTGEKKGLKETGGRKAEIDLDFAQIHGGSIQDRKKRLDKKKWVSTGGDRSINGKENEGSLKKMSLSLRQVTCGERGYWVT